MIGWSGRPRRFEWLVPLFGAVLLVIGGSMAAMGLQLVLMSGSPYYVIAGSGLLVAGMFYAAGRVAGAAVLLAIGIGTVPWALWEVGLAFWPLVPRLLAPAVICCVGLLLVPLFRDRPRAATVRMGTLAASGALAVGVAAALVAMFFPHGAIIPSADAVAARVRPSDGTPTEWRHYGNAGTGTRFVRAAEITPANVDKLEVAWTFSTGISLESLGGSAADQNTPLQIGDTLYACTPNNVVIAIDAELGRERWRFDPKARSPMWQRCRGVGYWEAPTAALPGAPTPDAPCARRIVLTTIDARLIQIDAATGRPCAGFGVGGTVDLKQGMGEIKPGYWYQTSAPTVAGDRIVVGGYHFDNQDVDEPSGVVRAFDAATGALAWAWDVGNPATVRMPPAGETYTRGTPNVWAPASFDLALGLVYLPTGNATPDFWGGKRAPEVERFGSSVVALDLATGRLRWRFQTVRHDLWDYDVASQPALYDLPDGRGGTVPALAQLTKRGQIFLLDRRDGRPLAPVVDQSVPVLPAAGDYNAATQPFSVGMPSIGGGRLSEADMWGATPLDQLWCRTQFRKLRYDGEFTPPNTTPSLMYPGAGGGMNWGSASIDEDSGYLIVNDIRLVMSLQLIPRAQADLQIAKQSDGPQSHAPLSPQRQTPFASLLLPLSSPLGVPCNAPPYGTMTAIDLNTRQIVWQRPMGTLEDQGPLGIKGLKMPVGMPTLGGPVTTSSGLIFFSGTIDHYLRALDVRTGEELWKARLPASGQTTPMTYVSPKSGRQFVVVSAGGSYLSNRTDKIVAYALSR